jgi:hypothetical protein
MLIAMAFFNSNAVKSALVNWLPWSVFTTAEYCPIPGH